MPDLRIGELFAGYSGIGMAVQSVLGGDIAWVSDIDPGACKILAHRYPDVPNIGDITTVDWSAVEPVDVLTGGSPCQDLSAAGKRGGMTEGTRSNLWVSMREAIAQLRPPLVVWENVRGAYSACADSELGPCPGCLDGREPHRPLLRAVGRVLGDLSSLGFDANWAGVRASDVGAPHGRYRVFVVAWPASDTGGVRRPAWGTTGSGEAPGGRARSLLAGRRLPPADTAGDRLEGGVRQPGHGQAGGAWPSDDAGVRGCPVLWGEHESAIRRWERLTRPCPSPVEIGSRGRKRISPAFSEWLMGLPAGWVTDVPGLTRNEQLKALGNGVVPQQAAQALRLLLPDLMEVAA